MQQRITYFRPVLRSLIRSGQIMAMIAGSLVLRAAVAGEAAPAALDLRLYAGLTITGAVDSVYSIEAVTDLTQTNNAAAWRCLDYVKLLSNPYLWTDKSQPAEGKRFYRAVQFPAQTNLVFISPGSFRIGRPTNELGASTNDMPLTDLTLTHGYWMGKYEVTQTEYLSVMGTNPSIFRINGTYPVDTVSWLKATEYCQKLTAQERAAGHIAANSVYRLPTEAEWEYACRAWTSTRYSFGDDPSYTSITNNAWVGENGRGLTHPVGEKIANPWGLYDMHGNVWEWCQDWWQDTLPGGKAIDPQGPPSGTYHVVRGGDFYYDGVYARSSMRFFDSPESAFSNIGFRVLLAPDQP